MKTTIDLPNQLMDEVKVLAAREQRDPGDLMAEWVREGLERRTRPVEEREQQTSAEQWLEDWIRLGEETLRDAPPKPTATEILAADRNRLR